MTNLVVVLTVLGSMASGQASVEQPAVADDVIDIRGIVKGDALDAEKAAARGLDPEAIIIPRVLRAVAPVFPDELRGQATAPTVVVECLINKKGVPKDRKVAETSNSAADRAAVDAVRRWSLSPLKLNGKARPALMTFRISFGSAHR